MPQVEDKEKSGFEEWKKKWKKAYATADEEEARFENFKENFREELDNPSSEPLWMVLSESADRPFKEHFGYIRLDRNLLDECDDIPDVPLMFYGPVKQEDGTIRCRYYYPHERPEILRQRKEDATVKHQSTVLPVKHNSDDKDDTEEEDKRQKTGCGGGQKQGCCSDSGN